MFMVRLNYSIIINSTASNLPLDSLPYHGNLTIWEIGMNLRFGHPINEI